jgi:hypothetical protein
MRQTNMSDLLERFRSELSQYRTNGDISEAIKVIDEQIAMEEENIRSMTLGLEDTEAEYRSAYAPRLTQSRQNLTELKQARQLFEGKRRQLML